MGLLWLLLVFPVILSGDLSAPAAYDQVHTHLPMIKQFAIELPRPSLHDYPSATTPGYHLLLALFAFAGAPETILRMISAICGLAVAVVVSEVVAAWTAGLYAVFSGILLLSCSHVLASSIWLTTDNLALACSLVTLQFATRSESEAPTAAFVKSAGWAGLATSVRQIAVWTSGCMLIAVGVLSIQGRKVPTQRVLLKAIAVLVPSIAVVAMFRVVWGGLVPPSVQSIHEGGVNFATPIYSLAVIGLWCSGLLVWIRDLRKFLFSKEVLLVSCCVAAISCSIPSNYSVVDGRWGGVIWSISRHFPNWGGRSMLVVILAVAGSMVLATIFLAARYHRGSSPSMIALCAIGVFIVTNSVNHECYERYLHPYLLALTLWSIAPIVQSQGAKVGKGTIDCRICVAWLAVLALHCLSSVGSIYLRRTVPQ